MHKHAWTNTSTRTRTHIKCTHSHARRAYSRATQMCAHSYTHTNTPPDKKHIQENLRWTKMHGGKQYRKERCITVCKPLDQEPPEIIAVRNVVFLVFANLFGNNFLIEKKMIKQKKGDNFFIYTKPTQFCVWEEVCWVQSVYMPFVIMGAVTG